MPNQPISVWIQIKEQLTTTKYYGLLTMTTIQNDDEDGKKNQLDKWTYA